jgi:hypothetical protein
VSPPDAPEAPEGAPDNIGLDNRLPSDRTAALRHDPTTCRTCLGFSRWTPERRADAASYAATAGRRICDLDDRCAARLLRAQQVAAR